MSIGVWRSWLAHLHGVQGVESSSLFTPTKKKGNDSIIPFFSFRLQDTGYRGQHGRAACVRRIPDFGFWILNSGFNPHSSLRLPQSDSLQIADACDASLPCNHIDCQLSIFNFLQSSRSSRSRGDYRTAGTDVATTDGAATACRTGRSAAMDS